jgi:hypothetical protein
MGAIFDMRADGFKMQVHGRDIGIGKNERYACITGRTYGSKNIGAFIA